MTKERVPSKKTSVCTIRNNFKYLRARAELNYIAQILTNSRAFVLVCTKKKTIRLLTRHEKYNNNNTYLKVISYLLHKGCRLNSFFL